MDDSADLPGRWDHYDRIAPKPGTVGLVFCVDGIVQGVVADRNMAKEEMEPADAGVLEQVT